MDVSHLLQDVDETKLARRGMLTHISLTSVVLFLLLFFLLIQLDVSWIPFWQFSGALDEFCVVIITA